MRSAISFAALAVACVLSPVAALAGQPIPVQVPEPGTLAMFAAGIGGAAIVLRLWRRK